MTTRALGRIVFVLVLFLFPLGLALSAQDGLEVTRLEATLATQGVLLFLRVQPLGQVGSGQSVMASAIAVSRPNETATIRGIRFVASVAPDTERTAYVDYEEIERFARAVDQMVTSLGQWKGLLPPEAREMQYTTKGGVGLHVYVDRSPAGVVDRSYLQFSNPAEATLVVTPVLEAVDLERFRDALHSGYNWLVKP